MFQPPLSTSEIEMAEAVATIGLSRQKYSEFRAIGLVSAAHFVNHFQNLVLPPLFPFLKDRLGFGFVELGFALTLANIVSVVAQLPVGILIDRLGSRRMLIAALLAAGIAFTAFGLTLSYSWLLLAMVLFGVSNAVFHPADYAVLSTHIAPARIGRAFSIHTFAGFLGNAIAPLAMLTLAAYAGLGSAIVVAGGIGLAAVVPLILARNIDVETARPRAATSDNRKDVGFRAVLTPAIIGLTGFFALLSLSGSGISNFSVVALTGAFGTPLSVANIALTAFLAAQAFGVLAGGFIADTTRRHAEVAAIGFLVNAAIVLAIGLAGFGTVLLVIAMALAGLLGGLIMPSRDMLVRAAAPPGAIGRTFGVVTSGFNIGGMIGPLMFGYIMDHGAPRWVFGASVIVMVITAAVAMVSDRRTQRGRRLAALPQPAE
jgi:MFS family permease